jgi:hypothetical protein
MVRDGTRFYDPLGLVSEGTKIDFQLQINSYLYGTRFMTWLARRYSPEQLIEWVSRREGSRGYYSAQFRRVFGMPLEQAWAEWERDERAFQQANLAAIRKYPVTEARDIAPRALGSVSRAHYDGSSRTIYAAFNYPGVVAHIGSIGLDDGKIERLAEIKGPVIYSVTSLAFDPAARALFYTTDNGAFRDLVKLDIATRRSEVLMKDGRIGDLVFSQADRSLWGIRHLNGICTLVRIPPPYKEWRQVFSWPYGTVPYDLDLSPDGSRLVASFGDISGRQEVRILDLQALARGETTPVAAFDFGPAVPNNFVFAEEGRVLYGSSYYTGVSNIFRYDLARKTVEAVSNAETGFFRPVPLGDGSLLVFRYSGEGFVPARMQPTPLEDVSAITFLGERLAEEHPVVKEWNAGSPARIPLEKIPQHTGRYRLAGGLKRESFYPILQGYKDTGAIGMRLNLSDPLQLNRLSLAASWSPASGVPVGERLHLNASYQRFDWRARLDVNGADFYDFFGPTRTSRKGYVAAVGRRTSLIFDQPRRLDLDVEGRVAGNLDRLPEYQNIAVDVDRLLLVDARLMYTNIRNSLGYVDDETGSKWSLQAQAQRVAGATIPRFQASYDRGLFVLPAHSTVWFRGAAGFSPRDRNQPFANFYFGAFGNNRVDHREEQRYRAPYSFPGLELNEIGGRNFVRPTLEWNLPPWRFRRAGTPGFYATWARPALFVTGLSTNLDASSARRTAVAAGGQIDFRFSLLSTLDMTISAGAALALEDRHAPRREAMVSLKILR